MSGQFYRESQSAWGLLVIPGIPKVSEGEGGRGADAALQGSQAVKRLSQNGELVHRG